MARLRERQNELEAGRIIYALNQLNKIGYNVEQPDPRTLCFMHKGSPVTLYPYTGWFTGKTVTDGRGIHNLIRQLKHGNDKT